MELQQELSKSFLKVPENFGEDLTSIMAGAEQRDILPFMKDFLEEQQKYIKCSSRVHSIPFNDNMVLLIIGSKVDISV